MNAKIKVYATRYSQILSGIYYWLMNNRVKGRLANDYVRKNAYLRGTRIKFEGQRNRIMIGGTKPSKLSYCSINVYGSNNTIIIEDECSLKDMTIYVSGNNNSVHIHRKTMISGKTELAVLEGTKIDVGEGTLFSANITLRTGDSHSVIDVANGKRLNKSRNIIVGDHVWIGNTVIITKGTILGSHCVVATGSVVTGKAFPNHCVVGGNPAKVLKEGIDWSFKLL